MPLAYNKAHVLKECISAALACLYELAIAAIHYTCNVLCAKRILAYRERFHTTLSTCRSGDIKDVV